MLLLDYIMVTTSSRQWRNREKPSGGSRRQTCVLTDRNLIQGRVPAVSEHSRAERDRRPSGRPQGEAKQNQHPSRSPLRIQGIR